MYHAWCMVYGVWFTVYWDSNIVLRMNHKKREKNMYNKEKKKKICKFKIRMQFLMVADLLYHLFNNSRLELIRKIVKSINQKK